MKALARVGTVCAVLMATLTLSSCGDRGESVTAQFKSASPLVEGNQVKLDGIVVGKITGMRVRNGLAEVTMSLEPEAMPLHSDATFTIRPASLLGERYVDVDRGSAGAPTLDMSRTVPVAQTAANVGLDEVLNTMDDPTSEGLAMLVTTLGTGIRGNGENVDQTVTSLAPDMKEIRALAAILKNHNELLGALIKDAEPIVGALADDDGRTLDRLVDSSDRLLSVTAAEQEDLEKTVDKLPGTLQSGRRTLKTLSDTADDAAPTLDALEPFTDDLPEISEELDDFADALDPALASSKPVLDQADKLLHEAMRPADDLRVASPEVASTVHGTRTIVGGLTTDREAMFTFIKRWALNTNGFDGLSHYWRVNISVNSDTWTALLGMLGAPSVPSLAAGTAPAKAGSAPAGASGRKSVVPDVPVDVPGVVNGVVQPLTGLTKKVTDGSLLSPKKAQGGGNTGLSKEQESGLLGFLFGGND
jgi:phospholipid/cholesterol/gamma-HCH transport system substrate-binding protein